MATRPAAIETRSRSHGPLGTDSDPSLRPLTSPRLPVAGDVPPELSPLDAFAAQSRLLARKLEEETRGGKRLSRLPPLSIESAFVAPRPGYFRSASAHDAGSHMATPHSPGLAMKMEVENASFRPISVHPRMSKIPYHGPRFNISHTQESGDEASRGRKPLGPDDILGTRKESPEPIDQQPGNILPEISPPYMPGRPSVDSMSQQRHSPRIHQDSWGYDVRALAPPRSPFAQKTHSLRSTSMDDSDEDFPATNSQPVRPNLRKFSSSSGLSISPISPLMYSHPRSPSACSDMSAGANRLSRPAFNFSRPLSRASEPQPEKPVRKASADSEKSLFVEETFHTPASMRHGGSSEGIQGIAAASSCLQSEISLPRGKMLQRDLTISPTLEHGQLTSLQAEPQHPEVSLKSVSPPSPPYTYSPKQLSSTKAPMAENDQPRVSVSNNTRPGSKEQSEQLDVGHAEHSLVTQLAVPLSSSRESPQTQAKLEPSTEGSAEWHVTKGIDCHERGSLNESTYHLRIAARQNHPTGMLLYALACRHGWGMRPNQQEGVQWLRKASDLAILEVADDEDSVKEGKTIDFVDQKTRKAQFALSIYELGVSHLNGWGIEQDKVLALRCFEIAGGKSLHLP